MIDLHINPLSHHGSAVPESLFCASQQNMIQKYGQKNKLTNLMLKDLRAPDLNLNISLSKKKKLGTQSHSDFLLNVMIQSFKTLIENKFFLI